MDRLREDLIEAFAAPYQDQLNLPLILPEAGGDAVFGFAKLEVMRAQALEGGMERRGEIW